MLKLLDKALLVVSKSLSNKPRHGLAAAEENISGHVVAGEYNGVELRVLDECVGDVANREEPSDGLFECRNINGIG